MLHVCVLYELLHSLSLSGVGAIPSPFDCYLANRGIRTLHVRMKQHQSNAFEVARFLEKSQYVEEVRYPGRNHNKKPQCQHFCTNSFFND